jgi:transposase
MIPRERLSVRTERSRPLILELEAWLREQRGKLSSKNDTAKANVRDVASKAAHVRQP